MRRRRPPPGEPSPLTHRCRTCGTLLLQGEARCWSCGAKPNADPPHPPAPAPPAAPPTSAPTTAEGVLGKLPSSAETDALAAAGARPPRFSLPVQYHLPLYVGGGCGCAASLVLLTLVATVAADLRGPLVVALLLGGGGLGYVVPALVLRYVIPARCPECLGAARLEGSRPVAYRCTKCGHVHRTGVTENQ